MALTHYGTLGVERTASAEEIKVAYRAMATAHHPDRGGDHDTMAALTVAYDTLGNHGKRVAYDALLDLTGKECGACAGAGRKYKQKGFNTRLPIRCAACDGEGFTAVKPVRVNSINMGGSKTKKRRVK